MKTEMNREIHDPFQEGLLASVNELAIPDGEKEIIRSIIQSGRECHVVRSDNRREHGVIIGINQDGRIGVGVKSEDGKQWLTKWPRIETFLGWQEKS